MAYRIHAMNDAGQLKSMGRYLMAGFALCALSVAAPAMAHDEDDRTIIINGVTIGGEGDNFLEKLIELDADDIDELRDEFAEAQDEILEAISDIEEAREDVKSVPGGGMILRVAFAAASKGVTEATDEAFDEVRAGLAEAEAELGATKDEVGPAEVAETTEAIEVIRTGIADVEDALAELTAAMKG